MSVGPTGPRTACSRYVVGGYTDRAGQGVGVLDIEGGRPVRATVVAEAENPSWVLVAPSGDVVYAALEREDGAVAAWRVSGDGPWPALGEQRSTGGSAPCHLALTPDGGAQDGRDADGGHACGSSGFSWGRRCSARGRAERLVVGEDAHLLVGDRAGDRKSVV